MSFNKNLNEIKIGIAISTYTEEKTDAKRYGIWTVNFDKGCYTGQEVVARIHYRGHVNQRLMGLEAPGDQPLPPAVELFREGRAMGRITSPVRSPRLGSIALGMIRREVDHGAFLAGSSAAIPDVKVRNLPFTLP